MEPGEETPPEGVHFYASQDEMPERIQKYWNQRYDLFSLYDEGIWLTDDAWFGVTPEVVASHIAQDTGEAVAGQKNVIIDCFAGAGGNAIAFALSGRWERIFAIEKDATVLACAKHNAAIYGVDRKIFWIHGDCFREIKNRFKNPEMEKDAVIFASPPWGGPEYANEEVFDLHQMEPYSLDHLHKSFSQITKEFILFLPRTSDFDQLANYGSEDEPLDVTHYNMNHHSKGIGAYFGHFSFL